MGRPTAEFFVDVIFSTTHALGVFWIVFPRALGRALHYKVGAQHMLCGKMHVSLKKGDVNKKFLRGRGYLQIVQERSGVAHSCLSTLGMTLTGQNHTSPSSSNQPVA